MTIDDSYTKVLLHMDGADASAIFTDESGKSWTASGNAQIDTAQSKFGGASGLFDGTNSVIQTPDSDDWTVGSSNFTLDCWAKIGGGAGTDRVLMAQMISTSVDLTQYSFAMMITTANKFSFRICSNTTLYEVVSNNAYTDSNWHHLAGVRNGNTLVLYVDGTAQSATANIAGITINNSTSKMAIGRFGEQNSNYWNGWIDELRFSKGIARWTANFTPPSSAYAPIFGSPRIMIF